MNTATYEHCSMWGSYTVDCEIVDRRDFTDERMNSMDRSFGFPADVVPKYEYKIKYTNPVSEEVEMEWVRDTYVTLPGFAGSL